MRRHFLFDCEGSACAATIDLPDGPVRAGLLIVSGGNEIRSGAHRGQARLGEAMAAQGIATMRYDRRGVGDSEGTNSGWRGAAADLAAAARAFRAEVSGVSVFTGFGICDGAAALLIHGRAAGIDRIVIANPWAYDHDGESEAESTEAARAPDAAHAKAYYLKRLSNPVALARDLLSGGIDLKKLTGGVASILKGERPSDTGARLARALAEWGNDATVLLSGDDRTAIHFEAQMKLAKARLSPHRLDGGSHSFATIDECEWLYARIGQAITD